MRLHLLVGISLFTLIPILGSSNADAGTTCATVAECAQASVEIAAKTTILMVQLNITLDDLRQTNKALEGRVQTLEGDLKALREDVKITSAGGGQDFDPFGNFATQWFNFDCPAGQFISGFDQLQSDVIYARGPGVDSEGKTRTHLAWRIRCSHIGK